MISLSEIRLKALERLKKKLENEVLWIYVSNLLMRKGELTVNELKKGLVESFGLRVNTFILYSILYRMEAEGLVEKFVKEGSVTSYRLTELGVLAYRKAIVYLEEKLLQLKSLL